MDKTESRDSSPTRNSRTSNKDILSKEDPISKVIKTYEREGRELDAMISDYPDNHFLIRAKRENESVIARLSEMIAK